MGNNHREAFYAKARAELVEDLEWWLENRKGTADDLHRALGSSRSALQRRMVRAGRNDLARAIAIRQLSGSI